MLYASGIDSPMAVSNLVSRQVLAVHCPNPSVPRRTPITPRPYFGSGSFIRSKWVLYIPFAPGFYFSTGWRRSIRLLLSQQPGAFKLIMWVSLLVIHPPSILIDDLVCPVHIWYACVNHLFPSLTPSSVDSYILGEFVSSCLSRNSQTHSFRLMIIFVRLTRR